MSEQPFEANILSHLRADFKRRFDAEPRIFRAPGRVNLIGEHTDYNDGFVLPAAIDLYTWAAFALVATTSCTYSLKICKNLRPSTCRRIRPNPKITGQTTSKASLACSRIAGSASPEQTLNSSAMFRAVPDLARQQHLKSRSRAASWHFRRVSKTRRACSDLSARGE